MQISGSTPDPVNQNFWVWGAGFCMLIRPCRWFIDTTLREMIKKNILLTTAFSADRNNTLTAICYERAIIDNKITITLGFNLLNFTGGRRGMCTDRADG